MDINDDALRALWQRQQPPSGLADVMARKIQRHRRVEKVRRVIEVALTVAGVALLTSPVADGRLSPGQWLLIPFFSVFLVASWSILLRQQTEQPLAALQGRETQNVEFSPARARVALHDPATHAL